MKKDQGTIQWRRVSKCVRFIKKLNWRESFDINSFYMPWYLHCPPIPEDCKTWRQLKNLLSTFTCEDLLLFYLVVVESSCQYNKMLFYTLHICILVIDVTSQRLLHIYIFKCYDLEGCPFFKYENKRILEWGSFLIY